MRESGNPATQIDVGAFIGLHLAAIESALDAGDVAAARRHLRLVRTPFETAEAPPAAELSGSVALTGQERASLRLLPDGSLSQKDIAREMGVTRNTLKTHLKSVYLKLGVHCRAEAITRARELGLLPRPLTLVTESGDRRTGPALDRRIDRPRALA